MGSVYEWGARTLKWLSVRILTSVVVLTGLGFDVWRVYG